MRTKLYGKSNAILSEVGNGVVAIIECGADEEIKPKLAQAIKDHFTLDKDAKLTFDSDDTVLTNQSGVTLSVEWVEDGEPVIRDFEMEVVATYN